MRSIIHQVVSFIFSVRSYNITAVCLAQYLASIYIFSSQRSIETLKDFNLHFLVLATACSISAGYLINNFYDFERDKINRPIRTAIDNKLDETHRLYAYIGFNFIALAFAALVSKWGVLFFIAYQGLIWLYSHKLNKMLIFNNLIYSFLSVLPFFVLLLYYHNYKSYLFIHAGFLVSILLIIDITKDLYTSRGDLLVQYKTVANTLGAKRTKQIILSLSALNIFCSIWIISKGNVGHMNYYFFVAILSMLISVAYIWNAREVRQYYLAQQIFKGIILLGILSIILVKI